MNKFTPGPWTHEGQGDITGIEDNGFGRGPVDVCSVYLRTVEGRHEANARLIAAAPDLLAALESLACSAPSACCVDFHHQPGDYHGADDACPALDRYEAACLSARAAIAKARGE